MNKLEYFFKAYLLKILYNAYPIPDPMPNATLLICKVSISNGIRPTTKHVPINVIISASIFILVKGSLKSKNDRMTTNAGAVYNSAVATGMVDKSIAVNIQKLKKMMLAIPVPAKYFISLILCNINILGFISSVYNTRIIAVDHARSVTTSIGENPNAYKCLTYQPIVPQRAAPKIMKTKALFKQPLPSRIIDKVIITNNLYIIN